MTRNRSDFIRWGVIILVLWAALALRLYRLNYQDIWWDEARNIDVATRPLAQVAVAPELDIHPPLYFYTLHAWTDITGKSSFATRFLSVWFGILTLALTWQLGRKLTPGPGHQAGLLTLIIAAFAPYGLAEAQETRMYTFSWAILAAGMLALLWSLQKEKAWNRWLTFALLAAAALLTHYSSIFVLAAWGVWLLIWALRCDASLPKASVAKGRPAAARLIVSPRAYVKCVAHTRRWTKLAGVGAVMVGVFLPVLPIALRQIPGYNNPNLSLPGLGQYLAQLYRAFTLGEFTPSPIWETGKWVWGVTLLGGAALYIRQRKQKNNWRTWSLLIIWLFGGLAIFYGVLLARSAFNARYISFILPAFWALAGWALTGWKRLARPLPWIGIAILLGLSIPSLHADLFDSTHFREDMSGVVRYLQAHATPDDIILVDQRYPFGFYWQRWNNDFNGLPPSKPADQAPAQYLFVDIARLDARLTQLAGQAHKVFWVTWYESDMDPRGAVPALLDAYGRLTATQDFRGYKVRTWQMTPPTTFHLPRDFTPITIHFDPGITLESGDWLGRQQPIHPDQAILIALQWRADGPTQRPLKVSVRLKDANGQTLAQDDRLLLSNGHLHSTAWMPGETALNIYRLIAPKQPGEYQLSVVLYDEETLAATGVSDGSGAEPIIGKAIVVAPKK